MRRARFVKGDNILLPTEDATRLISESLASTTLPELTEMTSVISQINTGINNLAEQNSVLTNSINNLTAQISTITIAALEGISIIILAIALILVLRKK